MKFDHIVIHDGKLYNAGQEVPIKVAETPKPEKVEESPVVEKVVEPVDTTVELDDKAVRKATRKK